MRVQLSAFIVGLILASSLAFSDDRPASPTIPALITGDPEALSFVVSGTMRSPDAMVMGFELATDGERLRCALYDMHDGTPLFLSNERETFAYDLERQQILFLPNARSFVRLEWAHDEVNPASFNFSMRGSTGTIKESTESWLRLDQFVEMTGQDLRHVESDETSAIFAYERMQNGTVSAIQTFGSDDSRFRFTVLKKDAKEYSVEIDAAFIGQPVPAKALRMPSAKSLAEMIAVHEVNGIDVALLPLQLMNPKKPGKFMLMQDPGGKALNGALLAEAKKMDRELGAIYRAALKAQGIEFRTIDSTDVVTEPADPVESPAGQ